MFELRPGVLVHYCERCSARRVFPLYGQEQQLPLSFLVSMLVAQNGTSPSGRLCPRCYAVFLRPLDNDVLDAMIIEMGIELALGPVQQKLFRRVKGRRGRRIKLPGDSAEERHRVAARDHYRRKKAEKAASQSPVAGRRPGPSRRAA